MINLGQLRDTIHFGSYFNPFINNKGNFNKWFVGTRKKCKNIEQKRKIQTEIEFSCRTQIELYKQVVKQIPSHQSNSLDQCK